MIKDYLIKYLGTQHRSFTSFNKEQLMVTTIFLYRFHESRLATLDRDGGSYRKTKRRSSFFYTVFMVFIHRLTNL